MAAQSVADSLLFGMNNIRTIGPSTTILATDLGQSHNPHVDEGLALFIGKVLEAGVDERDVEKMVRHNPAQMLG
jgi:predicted metal-dependent phosphotriesterase family hydrolase